MRMGWGRPLVPPKKRNSSSRPRRTRPVGGALYTASSVKRSTARRASLAFHASASRFMRALNSVVLRCPAGRGACDAARPGTTRGGVCSPLPSSRGTRSGNPNQTVDGRMHGDDRDPAWPPGTISGRPLAPAGDSPEPVRPIARDAPPRTSCRPRRVLLEHGQPKRRYRPVLIAAVLYFFATLAAQYLSLLTWWLVPVYRGPSWPKIMATYVVAYWLWVTAVPVVVWVGRRFPFDPQRRLRSVGLHLVALHLVVGAVLFAHALIQFAGLQLTPRPFGQTIQRAMALAAPEFLLIYLVLLLSTFAIDYFRKYRDRELRTAQLEASLQQAKLSALQAQLNPHFLFNALNAVSALMYRDVEAADAMLARIGELLRLTLASDGSHEIRLSEELELLERYLDIER